jgi:hypothetical protein
VGGCSGAAHSATGSLLQCWVDKWSHPQETAAAAGLYHLQDSLQDSLQGSEIADGSPSIAARHAYQELCYRGAVIFGHL